MFELCKHFGFGFNLSPPKILLLPTYPLSRNPPRDSLPKVYGGPRSIKRQHQTRPQQEMSFTNINDPAGVRALLDQLRSSQAWQETIVQSGAHTNGDSTNPVSSGSSPLVRPEESASTAESTGAAGFASRPSSSVAALLSQLGSPNSTALQPVSPSGASTKLLTEQQPVPRLAEGDVTSREARTTIPTTTAPTPTPQDVKSFTSQQAIPRLAQLANDPDFIASVNRMKDEQANLERQLWSDRRAIHKKYEEKVKVSRTKANMIGTGLTKHDADMISEAFRQELRDFDAKRALPAWDGLISKQQSVLESQAVPAMFVTSAHDDRERQQRVMKILEGILG